jgi:hypothetical protein
MANARKFEAIKWDWNHLWHIVSNDKCLHVKKKPKLPLLHSSKDTERIVGNLLQRQTPFKSVPWDVQLVKVFSSIRSIKMLIVPTHSKALTWHPLKI